MPISAASHNTVRVRPDLTAKCLNIDWNSLYLNHLEGFWKGD